MKHTMVDLKLAAAMMMVMVVVVVVVVVVGGDNHHYHHAVGCSSKVTALSKGNQTFFKLGE